MHVSAPMDFPTAAPLTDVGVEAASRSLVIVVARNGAFEVDGRTSAAFVAGPPPTPLPVRYLGAPACLEWTVPPWMGAALFDLRGDAFAGRVVELADLPRSPVRDVLLAGGPDPSITARDALANWWVGRARVGARLAARTWAEVEAAPERSVSDLAAHLGMGERRLRQVVRRETGLSITQMRRLVRHERATRRLSGPAASLADVALATGCADQSHMTREFTALAGITPTRLRKALAAGA